MVVPLTALPTGITHTANGDVYVIVASKIYRQKAAEGPFKLVPHTPATIWRTITSYEDTVYLVSSIISPKDIFTFDANGPMEYSVPKKGWLYDNLNRPLFNMYENGIEDV